jgi:hypothetical protein
VEVGSGHDLREFSSVGDEIEKLASAHIL